MWKTAFCCGIALSLEVSASTCNIQTIDDVALLFKNSPQEKEYQASTLEFIEKSKNRNTLRSRPELSASFDADKSEFKNNELNVELLFNIDEYRKYSLQKEKAAAESELAVIQNQSSTTERLVESSLAFFKASQAVYFNQKIDNLLSTVKSSEDTYQRRSIKGRDEEIVLNSLRLIKDNLFLKKTMLEDQLNADQALIASFGLPACEINYESLVKLLEGVSNQNFQEIDESNSLKLKELKFKEESIIKTADFEHRNKISNLKIGPVFSREVVQGETENRFGLGLSMDFPVFDNQTHNQFSESFKRSGMIETSRQKIVAQNQHRYLMAKLKKYSGILKQINSTQKIEGHMMKMKKSFDMGVISPLVYLDSYRSYMDYLETSQEAQLRVFETYLKLRGAYVENTIF